MGMRLKGKVAVVTGAASGIGAAIAVRFAEEGAKVVIGDISVEGEQIAARIRESGGDALYVATDIRSEESCRRLMQSAQDHFGGLHVLVNNAGVQTAGNVTTATEEDWERVMGVNLRGAWYCCKHAIPLMEKQGGGSIINIASTHAFRTQRNYFPYHSSKAGLMAMTLGICIDFGEKGIRANNICPGYIETPLTREHMRQVPNREEKERFMLSSHPLRRFGKPEDVANAALFLASDESSFISGTSLIVDGGRSAFQKADPE